MALPRSQSNVSLSVEGRKKKEKEREKRKQESEYSFLFNFSKHEWGTVEWRGDRLMNYIISALLRLKNIDTKPQYKSSK